MPRVVIIGGATKVRAADYYDYTIILRLVSCWIQVPSALVKGDVIATSYGCTSCAYSPLCIRFTRAVIEWRRCHEWRGRTKSRTTRAGRALDLAVRLG